MTTYDYLKSSSDERTGISLYETEFIYNKNNMLYTMFNTDVVVDTFKLKLDEYHR